MRDIPKLKGHFWVAFGSVSKRVVVKTLFNDFDFHENKLTDETHFQQSFCTKTCFNTEAKENLEMTYLAGIKLGMEI